MGGESRDVAGMNPFNLLRTLAHIKALEDDWNQLRAAPLFVKLLADAKTVSDDLGLMEKINEAIKAAQEPAAGK